MSRLAEILLRTTPLASPTPEQSSATREWAILMAVLILIGTITILVTLLLVLRHRRRLRKRPSNHAPEPIPDAWSEAGRRAEPADHADFLDENDLPPPDDQAPTDPPEEPWR